MASETLWTHDIARCINQIFHATVAKDARDEAMACADRLGKVFPLEAQSPEVVEAVLELGQAVWNLASVTSNELEAGVTSPTPSRFALRRTAAKCLLRLMRKV